jgi:hypothetical protein
MEFRKTSGAQAAAHRAPLSETEAPAKRDGRSHARQPARLGTLALDRRPQLKAALAAARKLRCHVAVAKLDRLSRDVHFISGLKEEAGRVVSIGSPFGTTYVSSAPSRGDFKMFGIKRAQPPPRFTGPRVRHRERGDTPGFIRATPLSADPPSSASCLIARPVRSTQIL